MPVRERKVGGEDSHVRKKTTTHLFLFINHFITTSIVRSYKPSQKKLHKKNIKYASSGMHPFYKPDFHSHYIYNKRQK